MYLEYVVTIAGIVAIVKFALLSAVIITLAKVFSKLIERQEEEKTKRFGIKEVGNRLDEECGCEFCGADEHKKADSAKID